jgi:asparagine synthase (glutamine-hydrolysing)
MCGIAGFVGRGDRHDLKAMLSALAHRGPDGEGEFVHSEARVHLGHRRLAVLDIAGGKQPMWNEEGDIGIVFNGEIYNHGDLRESLERRGHVFRSDHSDTEVLVHGYEEWGADLPARLNGMFAFAIYDRRRGLIFLARDRFGEKPLYYTASSGLFAFASELSALTKHKSVDCSFDRHALQKFFAYGYIPAPHTLCVGSRKLPGGHHLTYRIADQSVVAQPYWRFRIEPDPALEHADEDMLAEELRHLIVQATRRRLVSDVPLGVFLSGGIDSSTVVAAAAQSVPAEALSTFALGFNEPSFDESGFARSVAQAIGTRHHERILDLDDARQVIPRILSRLDEPTGDPSILPTYLLSAFTRERVTVALSGDGGDELFAGYDPFKALPLARLYARLVPKPLHRRMRTLAELLPISMRNMAADFKIRRGLMGLSYPMPIWTPAWMSPVEPALLRDLFETPLHPDELYAEAIGLWDSSNGDPVDRMLEFFTNIYLQDDILAKVDRATMAVSLESRAVFLDLDIVEFCRRLPHRFKYRNGVRKYILRKAMAPLMPPEVLRRPKKGFGIPLMRWLPAIAPHPPTHPIEGVRLDTVERMWREHGERRRDHRLFLWSWLSLQQLRRGGSAQIAEEAA